MTVVALTAGSLLVLVGPSVTGRTPEAAAQEPTPATTSTVPPDLINLATLEAQPTEPYPGESCIIGQGTCVGIVYPGGIYSATSDEITSLQNLEQQAVQNVVDNHDLGTNDQAAVLSWARPDADAELWTLLLQALGAVNSDSATTDQTNAVDWLTSVYTREQQLDAQDAGLEYTKWAGLGTSEYYYLLGTNPSGLASFLSAAPNPYSDGATFQTASTSLDGGYCVYVPPAPDQSQYTDTIYNSEDAPQTCYTPCNDSLGCNLPTPTFQNFLDWGAADADNDLFDNASYAGDVVAMSDAGVGLSVVGDLGAPALGAAMANSLGSVLAGSAFQKAVFPYAGRVDSVTPKDAAINAGTDVDEAVQDAVDTTEAASGEIAATGIGVIVSAVIFAITTAVQEGLTVVTASQVPGQLAQAVNGDTSGVDLPGAEADSSSNSATLSALYALVVGSTGPDPTYNYCNNDSGLLGAPQQTPCLNATPVASQSGYDPQWIVTPKGGNPGAPQPSIDVNDIGNGFTIDTSLYGNWFVDTATLTDSSGQSVTSSVQALSLRYSDWSGTEREAWLFTNANPPEFLTVATSDVGANFDPSTCQSDGSCSLATSIDYEDAQGNQYSATVTPGTEAPPLPVPTTCTAADEVLGGLCLPNVGPYQTTTSLTGPLYVAQGQSVTYTALLYSDADGTVTFSDGSQDLCTDVAGSPTFDGAESLYDTPQVGNDTNTVVIENTPTPLGESYTCQTTFSTSGPHDIFATFNGTSLFNPSQAELTTTVVQSQTTDTTSLRDYDNMAPDVGQVDTFADELLTPVGASNPQAPTGTVTFSDNGHTLCTTSAQPVNYLIVPGSFAQCAYAFQGVGQQTVTATYGGDANNAASITTETVTVNTAPSSTTVTASAAPVVGQVVSWTADVAEGNPSGNGPTPIGLVNFTDGNGDTICSDVPLNGGRATCDQTYAAQGLQSVTATYLGDTYTDGSSSSGRATVGPDATTTSLWLPSSGVVGQPIPVLATVADSGGGSNVPTGSVTFSGTGGGTCYGALNALSLDDAPCDLSYGSPVTSSSVTATYPGDTNDTGSSTSTTISIGQDDTTTSLALLPPDPVVGQQVTYEATVDVSAPGSSTPTGTFDFRDNNGALCTNVALTSSSLNRATAQCVGSYGSATDDAITATYGGDSNEAGSTDTLTYQFGKDSTTTTVQSPVPAAPVVGQPVTLSATVAVNTPGAGVPTGSVTIGGDGASCIGTLSGVSPYTASCTTTFTEAKLASIDAVYGGDGNDTVSGASTTVAVGMASTKLMVTATPGAAVSGQSVTLSATVSVTSPGAGTPTGTVTFSDAKGTLCTAPLNQASPDNASCSTSFGTPTTASVSAVYGGDSNFNGSSGVTSIKVTKAATATTLSTSSATSVSGQSITFTATVDPVAPAGGTPGGTVKFSFPDGGSHLPACRGTGDTVTLAGGSASCTISGLVVAQSPLIVLAVYSGSADYTNSAAVLNEVVTQASTSVAVTSSSNPMPRAGALTLTAVITVAAPGGGIPLGAVTWTISNNTGRIVACHSTKIVTSGQARDATCTLSAGETKLSGSPYKVKATYAGNADFLGNSGTLLQTVR